MLITVRTPPEDQTQEITASPAYSSTDEITFRHGEASNGGSTLIPTSAANRWQVAASKLNLYPGVYKMDSATAWVAFAQAANCDKILFRLYQKIGTDLIYQEGTEVDMTADQPGISGTSFVTTDLGDVEFTIADGEEWYYTVSLHNIASTGTNVGHRVAAASVAPDDEMYIFQNDPQLDAGPTALPTTIDASSESYRTEATMMRTDFKTSNRILFEGDYSAAKTVSIPHIRTNLTTDWWIKFQGAIVAAGENFTCLFQDIDGAGAWDTQETAVLDMGATDQVTFNGNNVALAVGEAGQTFDLGVNLRPATDKTDLFYVDKTSGQGGEGASDIATISHACKNGSARDLDYVLAGDMPFLGMSGTAAVAKIVVGWQPVILFGDSQTGTSTGDRQRLGIALPPAFTHERMWWLAAISGNALTNTSVGNHTAGYQRYCNDTPGLGDITEMTGAILCFCSYCVNDISLIGTTEASRDSRVSLILQRISEIMYDRSTKAQDTLFIGQPPYDGTNASEQEAQAVRQFNRGTQGIAAATRTPFYTPWSTLVDGSYEVAIPVSNKTYILDGGEPHYTTAGSQLVSANAVTQYELGTTPDRINQS